MTDGYRPCPVQEMPWSLLRGRRLVVLGSVAVRYFAADSGGDGLER